MSLLTAETLEVATEAVLPAVVSLATAAENKIKNERWSDLQLTIAVIGYLELREDPSVNKAQFYRDLAQEMGRDAGSVERRMHNLSSIFEDMRLSIIPGIKGTTLKNVGAGVVQRVRKIMNIIDESVTSDTKNRMTSRHDKSNADVSAESGLKESSRSRQLRHSQDILAYLRKGRPEQREFRLRVMRAYQSRCAISGCSVLDVLEAAHKPGRSWEEGHNQAIDGWLLRVDLHRLLDRGKLKIENEEVWIHPDIREEYGPIHGKKIAKPLVVVELGMEHMINVNEEKKTLTDEMNQPISRKNQALKVA